MSAKTRQQKRTSRKELPVETDWLWSCPPEMPMDEIAARLGFTSEPRTHLSARDWADQHQMQSDFDEALRDADIPSGAAHAVNWDALDERLRAACAQGRLLVIRVLPDDVPYALGMLIDIVGTRWRERGFHNFQSRSGARFAVVLAGWSETNIRVRTRQTTRYSVSAVRGAVQP